MPVIAATADEEGYPVWIYGVGQARRYIAAQAIADLSADVSQRGSDVTFCGMLIVRTAIVTAP